MEIKMIDLNQIHSNPLQPRQNFDREKLQELVNSIKESDLLQPIVVKKDGNSYEIIAGERRYKAFQILKRKKIPAIVWDVEDNIDSLEKSFIENWMRADLTDNEKRHAIKLLMDSGRYSSIADFSKKTGISLQSVREYVDELEFRTRVYEIPEDISHTRIRATRGLSDDVRKKAIEVSEKVDIPARKLEEVIVPKLKTLTEEMQIKILDKIAEGKIEPTKIGEIIEIINKAKSEKLKRMILEKPEEITPSKAKEILELEKKEEQDAVIQEIQKYRLTEDEVKERILDIKRAKEKRITPVVERRIEVKPEWAFIQIESGIMEFLGISEDLINELTAQQRNKVIGLLYDVRDKANKMINILKGI